MDFNTGELHPNTPHLFADLLELLLTTGYIGRARLRRSDLLSLLASGNCSPDELDAEDEENKNEEETGQTSAERNDRHERQADDVFTQLDYRTNALSGYYPFAKQDDGLSVVSELTEKQRVYRFLLACSRLRSFDNKQGVHQRWAKAFAQLSKFAMCGLMPKHADVRIFDANSDDRKNYYSTDLRNALVKLGEDLAVLGINEEECNKAGSSGDAGLDIVGVVKFDDGATSSYALLGQCGAQETGWPEKTLEAHPIKFRNFFQMQIDCPSIMFTPVCYRNADGEWTDKQSANGVLLLDRLRILKLLDLQSCWQEIVAAQWFLDFEAEFAAVQASD